MKLLAYLLLGAALLAAPACSKDDPTPDEAGTARYTLDGRVSEATASLSRQKSSMTGEDLLIILMVSSTNNKESVTLTFSKPPGAPESDWLPYQLEARSSTISGSYPDHISTNLTRTNGTYSSTFWGERRVQLNGGTSQISGSFTNVR